MATSSVRKVERMGSMAHWPQPANPEDFIPYSSMEDYIGTLRRAGEEGSFFRLSTALGLSEGPVSSSVHTAGWVCSARSQRAASTRMGREGRSGH
jgi:hypothetical protein